MTSAEIKMVRANLSRRFANVRRSKGGQWTATDQAKKVRILLGDDAAARDGSMQYSR
jgi:hypothetical protein